MLTGSFQMFDTALKSLVQGELGDLVQTPVTAVLISGDYMVDLSLHSRFLDIQLYEPALGSDYRRLALANVTVDVSPGSAAFKSDDINWGNPVTIPPVRYLMLVVGAFDGLTSNSRLLGFVDLDTSGGTVESLNSEFIVRAPAGGWFSLARQIGGGL